MDRSSWSVRRPYNINKEIRFKTSILQSDLCDNSDGYVVVKGTISVTGAANRNRKDRSLANKINAPFICCISKINNVLIDYTEDLDVVIPMYNLIEYSKNYSKTTRSLWNYFRINLIVLLLIIVMQIP